MSTGYLRWAALPVLTLAVITSLSCAEDTPYEGPASVDIAGTWDFGVTIVNETGVCAGNNEPPWNAEAEITVVGNAVTVMSDWNSEPGTGPHAFTGTLAGTQVSLDGSYPEGQGTTTAHFQLTVQSGNNRMEGTETLTWNGGAIGDCVYSGSLVVVNRVNP